MRPRALTLVIALACVGSACAPTLDWREVRPERSGLLSLFPCKPAARTRQLVLAGVAVEMSLHACIADGVTYAVAHADIGQPQGVDRALAEMASAAARNIDAVLSPAAGNLQVPGMTPNPQAGRHALSGRLANGQRVEEQSAAFARGTRVFQATMVGANLDAEAVDMFFGALRLSP